MTDSPNPPAPAETIPSVAGAVSALGSACAPFLYFESATAFGILNGVVQVTLEARRLMPTSPAGGVIIDRVIVGHLRTSMAGALALKSAIEGALLLASPSPSPSEN